MDFKSDQYGHKVKLELKEEICESNVNTEFKHENELDIDDTQEQKWYSQHLEDEEREYQSFTIKEEDNDDDDFQDANYRDYNPADYEDDDVENGSEGEDTAASYKKAKKPKCTKESDNEDEYCPNVIVIDKFLHQKTATIECHLCQQKFSHCYKWTRHMKDKHTNFMVPVNTSFDYWAENMAVCKICRKQLKYESNQFLHYLLKHTQLPIKYLTCKICNYKDFQLTSMQQHVNGKHPQSNAPSNKCPLCSKVLKTQSSLKFHFMGEHSVEFLQKFIYNCHLCSHSNFGNSQRQFFEHLMNEHNLNNPAVLQFTQYHEMYKCIKCNKLYVDVNIHTLLEHYITHDTISCWSCKYCENKYLFQDSNLIHMCNKMLRFYQKHSKEQLQSHIFDAQTRQRTTSDNKNIPGLADQSDTKLINWKTFEQSVRHIYPFCNNEFTKFQQWQLHMRESHRIDTLEGLQMATVPSEPQKLQCLMCLTFVPKTSINLHTHRFQHLPFKPYKCRFCFKTLRNYNLAMQHIINQCRDDCASSVASVAEVQETASSKNKITENLDMEIEISCCLCKGEQFSKAAQIIKHYQVKHNNFKDHFHKSSNGNDTVCNICEASMRRFDRHVGVGHFVQHLDQRPFKCKKCQRSFSYHRKCKLHISKYHVADEIESVREHTVLEKAGGSTYAEYQEFIGYACPECNESLCSQSLWEIHVNQQHDFFDKSNVALLDNKDGTCKCKECGVTLTNSTTQQQQHKLSHMPYKSYICLLCYYRFNRLADLHRHMKTRHFSLGSFMCPICPVQTSNAYERSEHIKQSHHQSEWPRNMCLLCLDSFKHLRKHMETHELSPTKKEA